MIDNFRLLRNLLLALLFFLTGYGSTVFSQLLINEFQPSNQQTIADEDGSYEDWIELFNSGSTDISLNGYGLTDNSNPFKWTFPDTLIRSGEYMLIFASGKNRRIPGKTLHTNFKISNSGEIILLCNSSGITLDFFNPGSLPSDISFGRYPDGAADKYYFVSCTPGKANDIKRYNGIADKPAFSSPAGIYNQEFELSISSTNASIHYTLDCSEPTEEDPTFSQLIPLKDLSNSDPYFSTIRPNPFKADEWGMPWRAPSGKLYRATIVRARSFREGYLPSEILTQTYLIDAENQQHFTLPLVSLVSDSLNIFGDEKGIYVAGNLFKENGWGPGIWGFPFANYWQNGDEWERPASLEFLDSNNGSYLNQNLGISIHGGASRINPHKSFKVEARSIYGPSRIPFSFIPGQANLDYKSLILRSSGQDFHKQTTMFRDAMTQALFSHLNLETQAYIPSIMFVNGDYWGITNIRERYDKYYIGQKFNVDPENIDFLTGNREVIEGSAVHINAMINYMANNDISDSLVFKKVSEMLDVDNFIDYNIANIFINNTDWPGNNRDFWRLRTEYSPGKPKGQDGRWRYMLYDTDFGFGLNYGTTDPAANNTLAMAIKGGGNSWPNPYWSTFELKTLLENLWFREEFINRFMDYMNTFLKPENVINHINQFADRIQPEMEYHIYRWGYPASYQQWLENVDEMRRFAEIRPAFQRDHIMDVFNLANPYTLIVDVNKPGAGKVKVNSMLLDESGIGVGPDIYPWEGLYFPEIPVTVSAIPETGFEFRGWKEIPDTKSTIILRPAAGETLIELTAEFYSTTDIRNEEAAETSLQLGNNFPNPFDRQTNIPFSLGVPGDVTIDIYCPDGIFKKRIYESFTLPGSHKISCSAEDLATGLYFYQLTFVSKDKTETIHKRGKMIVMK